MQKMGFAFLKTMAYHEVTMTSVEFLPPEPIDGEEDKEEIAPDPGTEPFGNMNGASESQAKPGENPFKIKDASEKKDETPPKYYDDDAESRGE
jgi:hypothetical protein